MKPTSAPLSAVDTPPSQTTFAKLSKEKKGEETAADTGGGEPVDQAGGEGNPITPPEQKGGESSTAGLIDLPIGKTPGIAGKYVEMLDREYGLVLDSDTGAISIRMGEQVVKIPKLSEWMEGENDGEKRTGRGARQGR